MAERRLGPSEMIEIFGSAVALAMASVIQTLHRQSGLSIEAVQADLLKSAARLTHSDPDVEKIATTILVSLQQTLQIENLSSGGRA